MMQSVQAVNAAVQPGWAGRVSRRSVSNRQPLVVPNLWHVSYDVGRYPTDLWGLQATRPAQAQVLVVPGNPGCAAFYRKFMQQLHTAFGGAADVMAVSHVGHDADNIIQGAVWALDCQVDHKAQLLQELMAPGKPPVIILAHSIGSYIMLQVSTQSRPLHTADKHFEHASVAPQARQRQCTSSAHLGGGWLVVFGGLMCNCVQSSVVLCGPTHWPCLLPGAGSAAADGRAWCCSRQKEQHSSGRCCQSEGQGKGCCSPGCIMGVYMSLA